MKSGLRATVAAIPLSAAAVLLLSVTAEAPIKTTVCELVNQPNRFDGKIVQVRGTVISGMETGGVTDPTCSAFLLVDSLETVLSEWHDEIAYLKSRDEKARISDVEINRTPPRCLLQ